MFLCLLQHLDQAGQVKVNWNIWPSRQENQQAKCVVSMHRNGVNQKLSNLSLSQEKGINIGGPLFKYKQSLGYDLQALELLAKEQRQAGPHDSIELTLF
jgi:hypothetical protein